MNSVEATLQDRVEPWFRDCFPPDVCNDRRERGDRFLEDALELLQSGGYDRSRVATLVDYVWGRPIGQPAQEVGGTMITLAAYCIAHGIDMHRAGEIELERISAPDVVAKIRAKQASKRGLHTPLPTNAVPDDRPEHAEIERLRHILTFDCTSFPGMEDRAIHWANRIAGSKGEPGLTPDPVMILEMCEDIARAALLTNARPQT